MDLKLVRVLMAAAESKAQELDIKVAICVMDAGGNLVAFERMPEAQLASTAIAQGKAYTAVSWERPSIELFSIAQPGIGGYGINTIDPRFVLSDGGIPLRQRGRIVGAVGISGGTGEQDGECARAVESLFSELVRN